MTSNDVRNKLTEALTLDLIGPSPGSSLADETLCQAPSRWYLTGFLVPNNAPESQKYDETVTEELDKVAEEGSGADEATPETGPVRRALFPSSMGVSLLVPKDAKEVRITVCWGDYKAIYEDIASGEEKPIVPLPKAWKRTQRSETIVVALPLSQKPVEGDVPNSDGLKFATAIRPIRDIPAFAQFQQ